MATRVVKSVDRTIDVLELFHREQRPLSLKEISEFLSIPTSSTAYLMKSLCGSGHFNYNKTFRNYFPTSRLKAVGSWIDDHFPDNSEITDFMKRIRQKFGETVAVGIRNEQNLQYLKSFESDYPIRYHIREGDQRPLLEASMGWMIMAELPPREVEAICFRYNQQRGQQVFNYLDVHKKLETIRKEGHCVHIDLLHSYTAISVAMKLPMLYNQQNIVVGVGGDINRVEPRIPEITAEMKRLFKELM